MAKKGDGNKKRSFWDNPFGGIFDFNGDGKEDIFEQWVAFNIFNECTKEVHNDNSSNCILNPVFDDDNDTSWREFCEDGLEYGVIPEDYETEEEYEEALNEAKFAWRNTCEDGSDYDIDPYDYDTKEEYEEALDEAQNEWRDTCEDGSDYDIDPYDYDTKEEYEEALKEVEFACLNTCDDELENIIEENYPNKRRYLAADTLANEFIFYSNSEIERRVKDCCRFIVDYADTITAANYLSHDAGFLYAQAIKDNFDLPISLPDEDEYREYEFYKIIKKIAKRDIALSFEVWEWCLATFIPYEQYSEDSVFEMTSCVIDEIYNFPDSYMVEFVSYLHSHPDFMQKIMPEKIEISSELALVIFTALQNNLFNTALILFKKGLIQADNDWNKIIILISEIISWCKNYEELESAEYFKFSMFPLVKSINIDMVQDEIEEWEKELDEYISEVEADCPKYAYTRKNAWRKTVPDGSKYYLDPCDYDTEQEYLEVFYEEKYSWRKLYEGCDLLGLDVNDFETQAEFQKVYNNLVKDKQANERNSCVQKRNR